MPLLEARKQYKPFEYPWAFEYWKRQQQIHWMPEEVPLGEDCRDWAQKLDRPSATCSPRSSASSPRPTSRCRIATTTNTAACSSRPRSR